MPSYKLGCKHKKSWQLLLIVEKLALHYQPIVNGKTGEVETFEALIRWHHPHRGLVSPAEFIPLAEQTGLIDRIGSWVIETACQEAMQWKQPWRVAVNVSPKQFQQSDVCEVIIKALGTCGLAASRLVVEVTEGILIDDADKAVKTLNGLREIGVRVALDDFGTGYSSLSYLQLFKFDKFKIDQSFVRKLGVIAHPVIGTALRFVSIASATRRSSRTERPFALVVLTTERNAA